LGLPLPPPSPQEIDYISSFFLATKFNAGKIPLMVSACLCSKCVGAGFETADDRKNFMLGSTDKLEPVDNF
jgi:hypothetical protein